MPLFEGHSQRSAMLITGFAPRGLNSLRIMKSFSNYLLSANGLLYVHVHVCNPDSMQCQCCGQCVSHFSNGSCGMEGG